MVTVGNGEEINLRGSRIKKSMEEDYLFETVQ
jgi:hypothetical protein